MQYTKKRLFLTGSSVATLMWVNFTEHPSKWDAPVTGVVLSDSDPAAYEKVLHLPAAEITAEMISERKAWCEKSGFKVGTTVPVLFRDKSVCWIFSSQLRSYAEVIGELESRRCEAIQSLRRRNGFEPQFS